MDGIYPHGKDVQSSRPIRSQTPINTDNYSSLLSGSAMRLNCVGPNRVFIDYQVAFLGYQVGFMVHLWCRRGGQDGNNILISAYQVDTMDNIVLYGQDGQVRTLIKSQLTSDTRCFCISSRNLPELPIINSSVYKARLVKHTEKLLGSSTKKLPRNEAIIEGILKSLEINCI